MLKKTCPHCNSISYSASSSKELWICPQCLVDISDVPSEAPESSCTDNEKSSPSIPQKAWNELINKLFQK